MLRIFRTLLDISRYTPVCKILRIQAGEYVRFFHQQVEGFLRSEFQPMFDLKPHQCYIKLRHGKRGDTGSSNTIYQLDLPGLEGGILTWNREIRIKHTGTLKYVVLHKEPLDEEHPGLVAGKIS